jgi:hypothetical protein
MHTFYASPRGRQSGVEKADFDHSERRGRNN